MASRRHRSAARARSPRLSTNLRIIGGKFRGSTILYHGDPTTRPMKERVREAVFNLVGPAVKGKFVIDLFAGTGAMALEAISRGADGGIVIERSFPCAAEIRKNTEALGIADRITIETADTFVWRRRGPALPDIPQLVFCCPPYDYYLTRSVEMTDLVDQMILAAPTNSVVVVECDGRFDTTSLPQPDRWDVRHYAPATVAVLDVE